MLVFKDWIFTPEKAALHVSSRTVVISDVHLGYQQVRRARGESVPLISVEEHLSPLLPVIASYSVSKMVIAGDLFEQKANPKLIEELQDWLADTRLELLGIVPGNHDRGIELCEPKLPLFPDGIELGNWRIVHGHKPLPRQPVLQGHFHPSFQLGVNIKAPCYLVSGKRIVLPAFSPDAAGVNVLAEPRWRRFRCLVCAGEKILDFGELSRMQKTG